jgi:hypothetical protein
MEGFHPDAIILFVQRLDVKVAERYNLSTFAEVIWG